MDPHDIIRSLEYEPGGSQRLPGLRHEHKQAPAGCRLDQLGCRQVAHPRPAGRRRRHGCTRVRLGGHPGRLRRRQGWRRPLERRHERVHLAPCHCPGHCAGVAGRARSLPGANEGLQQSAHSGGALPSLLVVPPRVHTAARPADRSRPACLARVRRRGAHFDGVGERHERGRLAQLVPPRPVRHHRSPRYCKQPRGRRAGYTDGTPWHPGRQEQQRQHLRAGWRALSRLPHLPGRVRLGLDAGRARPRRRPLGPRAHPQHRRDRHRRPARRHHAPESAEGGCRAGHCHRAGEQRRPDRHQHHRSGVVRRSARQSHRHGRRWQAGRRRARPGGLLGADGEEPEAVVAERLRRPVPVRPRADGDGRRCAERSPRHPVRHPTVHLHVERADRGAAVRVAHVRGGIGQHRPRPDRRLRHGDRALRAHRVRQPRYPVRVLDLHPGGGEHGHACHGSGAEEAGHRIHRARRLGHGRQGCRR